MRTVMISTLLALLALAGCVVHIGDGTCEVSSLFSKKNRAKVHWEEDKHAAFVPGTTLRARTDFGDITVTGGDGNECTVLAEITVQAPKQEQAQEIADRVSLSLKPVSQGSILEITVDKPKIPKPCSVHASFHITLPCEAHLDLDTSFGEIRLENIQGEVKAITSHGEIHAERLIGSTLALKTSFGTIRGQSLETEHLHARTSHGAIHMDMTAATPPSLQADLDTSFGEIRCTLPPTFAGEVNASTSFGDIHCDFPITVNGTLGKSKLKGHIGEGPGQVRLNTSFGSIHILK